MTPLDERENAEQAAEDDLFRRPPTRRCLRCGGPLQVVTVPSAYQVICVDEQRVLLIARGV